MTLLFTFFLGSAWYYISGSIHKGQSDKEREEESSWYHANGLEEYGVIESLAVSCYWAITTLSVVGYGDLFPVNKLEMFLGALVLLGGVGFFSFVMSSIVDIVENYSEIGAGATKEELNIWLTSFERFTANQPLPKRLHE